MKVIRDVGLTFNDVLLVPQGSSITSRKLVDTSVQLTPRIRLKTPIVSANMDTVTEEKMAIEMARAGGLGVIHRFLTIQEQADKVELVKSFDLLVGAAVGASVGGDYLERAEALVAAGVDVLVVDVAHGHADHVCDAVKAIKARFPNIDLIAGNVATLEGVNALKSAGADCIKVGIGPGTACSTRIVTGCGVPQLTAIMECSTARIPIIADGGIKHSGDIVKALAAGATAVMLGSMLAGADEAPGEVVKIPWPNDLGMTVNPSKVYRGMASTGATRSKLLKEASGPEGLAVLDVVIVPEGVETTVPLTGPVANTLEQLLGGLRSGMSYCNANDIQELQRNATFIQITPASWTESLPAH